MQWQFLSPEMSGFDAGFPNIAQTAVAMVPVADHQNQLFESEAVELESMTAVRRHAFTSGRHCAHLAQQMLGLTPKPVGRAGRVPIWPEPSVGSITHSSQIAAAAASTSLESIGIDIEEMGRVEEKLHRKLFTDGEIDRLPRYDFDASTLVFSAKEAGYKAIYPMGQQFVGFQEAEIKLSVEQTFTITYLGKHPPNRRLEQGQGYWHIYNGHVLTLFVIS